MEDVQLLKRIEDLRSKLYLISQGKDLVDPEVVQMSQELDTLLNIYNRDLLKSDFRRYVN